MLPLPSLDLHFVLIILVSKICNIKSHECITGSIRVYCRVRPFLPGQKSVLTTVDHLEESTITIATPSKYGKEGQKSFTFNKVFGPSASQGDLFPEILS